uniref:Uncharacterized protein n=1 Tax=Knipowitschia caucasica TaxID=637954 RepID=A0AAV2KWV7_KNICA
MFRFGLHCGGGGESWKKGGGGGGGGVMEGGDQHLPCNWPWTLLGSVPLQFHNPNPNPDPVLSVLSVLQRQLRVCGAPSFSSDGPSSPGACGEQKPVMSQSRTFRVFPPSGPLQPLQGPFAVSVTQTQLMEPS